MCSVAREQTDTHESEYILGFQEFFLQPIIKDRSKILYIDNDFNFSFEARNKTTQDLDMSRQCWAIESDKHTHHETPHLTD